MRPQRAEVVGQLGRQHRRDQAGHVGRERALGGAAVERRAGRDEVRDVGDVHPGAHAVALADDRDRVVEVLRRVRVDREGVEVAQVGAPLERSARAGRTARTPAARPARRAAPRARPRRSRPGRAPARPSPGPRPVATTASSPRSAPRSDLRSRATGTPGRRSTARRRRASRASRSRRRSVHVLTFAVSAPRTTHCERGSVTCL